MTAKLTSVPAALYIVDLIREDIFKRFDCTLWTDGCGQMASQKVVKGVRKKRTGRFYEV